MHAVSLAGLKRQNHFAGFADAIELKRHINTSVQSPDNVGKSIPEPIRRCSLAKALRGMGLFNVLQKEQSFSHAFVEQKPQLPVRFENPDHTCDNGKYILDFYNPEKTDWLPFKH